MTAYALLIPALALLAPAPDTPDEANKKDAAKLQGDWKVQQFRNEGDDKTADDLARMAVAFDGDKFTVKTGEKAEEATFKLDATKSPATIDFVPREAKDKTIQGIYKIDGDTVAIAFGTDFSARPTEFTSKPKSQATLMVLKREKK